MAGQIDTTVEVSVDSLVIQDITEQEQSAVEKTEDESIKEEHSSDSSHGTPPSASSKLYGYSPLSTSDYNSGYISPNSTTVDVVMLLNNSLGESDGWRLTVSPAFTSYAAVDNFTTTFASVTLVAKGSSTNARLIDSSFKATGDDLVAGDYMSWGTWNASILYDDSNHKDAEHIVSGLWIAGKLTPLSVVDALNSANAVAYYEGKYKAMDFRNYGDILTGRADLNVDFGNDSAKLQIYLEEPSATYTPVGFNMSQSQYDGKTLADSAGIAGMQENSQQGVAMGTFYGTNAESVGGTFNIMSGSMTEVKGVYQVNQIQH